MDGPGLIQHVPAAECCRGGLQRRDAVFFEVKKGYAVTAEGPLPNGQFSLAGGQTTYRNYNPRMRIRKRRFISNVIAFSYAF